jgi:nuclear pore complex protein Nup107
MPWNCAGSPISRGRQLAFAVQCFSNAKRSVRMPRPLASNMLTFAQANEGVVDEAADEGEDIEAWIGNHRRTLWKSSCARAALNVPSTMLLSCSLTSLDPSQPNLPSHERVLYAVLAPSPQTFPVLKSACRTWEDHVWAQVGMMCEEKQTVEMAKLGGGWWEGGIAAVEKGTSDPAGDATQEEDTWYVEVMEGLQNLKTVRVEEG